MFCSPGVSLRALTRSLAINLVCLVHLFLLAFWRMWSNPLGYTCTASYLRGYLTGAQHQGQPQVLFAALVCSQHPLCCFADTTHVLCTLRIAECSRSLHRNFSHMRAINLADLLLSEYANQSAASTLTLRHISNTPYGGRRVKYLPGSIRCSRSSKGTGDFGNMAHILCTWRFARPSGMIHEGCSCGLDGVV